MGPKSDFSKISTIFLCSSSRVSFYRQFDQLQLAVAQLTWFVEKGSSPSNKSGKLLRESYLSSALLHRPANYNSKMDAIKIVGVFFICWLSSLLHIDLSVTDMDDSQLRQYLAPKIINNKINKNREKAFRPCA